MLRITITEYMNNRGILRNDYDYDFSENRCLAVSQTKRDREKFSAIVNNNNTQPIS